MSPNRIVYKRWQLCDFHIHTDWSDGQLSVKEVIDLYGQHGFDIIAITDHIVDDDSLKEYRIWSQPAPAVLPEDFDRYLATLRDMAYYAWEKYELLLIPGMEITNTSWKYHILGLDIQSYIDPYLSVVQILEHLKHQDALSVACHPFVRNHTRCNHSRYLSENIDRFGELFDAWEVANRNDLSNEIGLRGLNYIANSDFHEPSHLSSWKTLLLCEKNIESVKHAIRRNHGVSLYFYRQDQREVFIEDRSEEIPEALSLLWSTEAYRSERYVK